jgi:hypothetical protein
VVTAENAVFSGCDEMLHVSAHVSEVHFTSILRVEDWRSGTTFNIKNGGRKIPFGTALTFYQNTRRDIYEDVQFSADEGVLFDGWYVNSWYTNLPRNV